MQRTREEINPLLTRAIEKAKRCLARNSNVLANCGNYNDGGGYGDGYGDSNYGDQSYGEGPAG